MATPPMPRFRRLLADAPIYLIGTLLLLVVLTMAHAKGVRIGWSGIAGNASIFFAIGVVLILADAPIALFRARPRRPALFLRDRYCSPRLLEGVFHGAPPVLLCIVLLPVFSAMKSMIPLFNAYSWDGAFIAADRAIFFGRDAWEVLHPLIGFPLVTSALSVAYHLWFLLLYAGVYFFAFARVGADLRRRFFLCYVLSWWLIGGAMATAFASVGPCFLAPMFGDHRFDGLMAYLHDANRLYPVMVLDVQHMLLQQLRGGQAGLGSGITAMPSMHVAVAMLYGLAMREVSRWAGRAFLVFAAIIWIGSVHTGYHYFVDGLVSVICIWAIWRLSAPLFRGWDRLVARFEKQRKSQSLPEALALQ